jgi:hypothetical protein
MSRPGAVLALGDDSPCRFQPPPCELTTRLASARKMLNPAPCTFGAPDARTQCVRLHDLRIVNEWIDTAVLTYHSNTLGSVDDARHRVGRQDLTLSVMLSLSVKRILAPSSRTRRACTINQAHVPDAFGFQFVVAGEPPVPNSIPSLEPGRLHLLNRLEHPARSGA